MTEVIDQRYEVVPVDGVRPHPDNPRRGDIASIQASIDHNGFFGAVLAQRSTGYVIAGNHRWRAAKEAGLESVPVIWVDVDVDEARRIMLADNRTNDQASYDPEGLIGLLSELALTPEGLAGTGYDPDDLADLNKAMAGEREIVGDPDQVPEPPKQPRTILGDVWLLGPHRLICGDATEPSVLERLMGDGLADLVWTDPPYGVAIVGGHHALSPEQRLRRGGKTIQNDMLSADNLTELLRGVFSASVGCCRAGACWYVTAPGGPLNLCFGVVLNELGIWRQTLVWLKDSFVMGRSDYHGRHEAMFYGWVPGASHHPPPDRKQDTVWEVPRPSQSKDHPTMKPVALVERSIGNSTDLGDLVLDPFGGSGSTLIAAHLTGRAARLVELDPVYCDVICRRYQDATGDKPIAEATGEPHDFTEALDE